MGLRERCAALEHQIRSEGCLEQDGQGLNYPDVLFEQLRRSLSSSYDRIQQFTAVMPGQPLKAKAIHEPPTRSRGQPSMTAG